LGDLEQSYATRRVEDDVTSLQRVQDHDSKHLQKPHYAKLRPIIARASTYGIPIQQHLHILYQQYPILTQIALACIVTFITWHVRIQSLYKIMSQYFVCHQSHMTLRNGKFLSLLLSAISHIDVWHLLYNLMALLSLGPSVQAVLESKLSTKGFVRPKYPDRSIFASIDTAMWLLVLGAALSGSIAYLLWNDLCGTGGSAGGCLGLSSVTMSMLSIYASAYPDRILQFRVGGSIPVRLPAHQILLLAFVGSIVGCLFPVIFKSKRNDGISHSGHLGGLIFGVVYYDIAIMNRRPFINSFFATLYSRFQRAVSKNSL
jgi:membrane associated rhomboid family serine protease